MDILIVKDDVPTKTELKTNKREDDGETLLSDLALLKQHVKLCMTSFSNYFMVTKTETTDLNTKKSIECLEIIAAMIVEQNVLMTKGNERALIHCICVTPDLRRMNIGTALMKTVMIRNEYHNKDIMAVTSLPQHYRVGDNHENMVSFFTTFDFKDMSKQDKDKGENNIDNIVLKGACIQLANNRTIIKRECTMEDYKTENGYYEIDNDDKYSIVHNPNDNCIYARVHILARIRLIQMIFKTTQIDELNWQGNKLDMKLC